MLDLHYHLQLNKPCLDVEDSFTMRSNDNALVVVDKGIVDGLHGEEDNCARQEPQKNEVRTERCSRFIRVLALHLPISGTEWMRCTKL